MKPLEANRERVGDNMVLARKCRVTHELVTLTVTIVEYYRWKGGECSQNVWPDLTPDEREFIQTGYTQAEWESIFSSSDEEDEVDQEALDRERKAHEEYLERREMRRPQSERDLEDDLLNRRRPFA
jgi:hypothetical protein